MNGHRCCGVVESAKRRGGVCCSSWALLENQWVENVNLKF